MSSGSHKWSFLFAVLALSMSAVAQPKAEGDATDPAQSERRWIPGFAVTGGVTVHERTGTTSSIERGTFRGDTTPVFGFLGGSLEVASPVLAPVPGRPRLFAHLDVAYSLDQFESVTNEGAVGQVVVPDRPFIPLESIEGRGSALRVQAEPLLLGAGLGATFSMRAWDRVIRLKPSVQWMWQEDDVRLLFGHAESEGADPSVCGPCRTVEIRNRTTEGFHSLGPGLELEFDTSRAGDFMLTAFSSFRALHVLGDRDTRLTGVGSWKTDNQPSVGRADTSITSVYEREPWNYQFLAGVRLRWLPE